MEMFTTEPGVQFYSGNFLDGYDKARTASSTASITASASRPSTFPTRSTTPISLAVLEPGQTYTQTTIYKFSASREAVDSPAGAKCEDQ